MNNNFNANEITQIVSQIEMAKQEMEKLLNKIGNDFSVLSGIVASEDSSLSNTCRNIDNTYKNLSVKLSNNLEEIKSILNKYIQETLQNEVTSAQNLTQSNDDLSNAKSILDSI